MKTPLNDRQLEVLQWVADNSPADKWPENDFSYKLSAAALKTRGLLTITGHARTWAATITEAGTYYLEHGSYLPEPHVTVGQRPASDHEPVALKDAKELIERLNAEGTVTVTDPDASTRARYRRVLHACKTHSLVPAGQELRYTGRDTGDIIMNLVDGSSAEEADWNRIRLTARKITTNIGSLRTALMTSTILDQLSEELRPRAIEFLVELAEHLRAQDLRLGANVKLKTPKLFLQVGTRRKDIALTEILDEVPHGMTAAERRELRRAPWTRIPQHDQVRSGRLMLRVARDGSHEVKDKARGYTYYRPNADEYAETKRQRFNTQARRIARAIKKGIDDDTAAQERAERHRVEAQLAHEQQLTEKRRTWESVRSRARDKALLELREATFARAFQAWQQASELREFAQQLETGAADQGLIEGRPRLRQLLQWARTRADEIDPVTNLAQLDDEVFDAEPSADDLRPHMEGWDPSEPHKDYGTAYRRNEQPPEHVPQPRPWHPGMIGRPSWWRQ